MDSNKEFMETNKKRWDELVEIHSKSKSYDLEGFLKGKNSLHSVELELLGNIKGKKYSIYNVTLEWIPFL